VTHVDGMAKQTLIRHFSLPTHYVTRAEFLSEKKNRFRLKLIEGHLVANIIHCNRNFCVAESDENDMQEKPTQKIIKRYAWNGSQSQDRRVRR
jgi:hypothetical protein